MTAKQQKLIIELAEEGIEHREYVSGKTHKVERDALQNSKDATGLFFSPIPEIVLPRLNNVDDTFENYKGRLPLPAMSAKVKAQEGFVQVAVFRDNNDAYRERQRWRNGGFTAKTEKKDGGIRVMACWGMPA